MARISTDSGQPVVPELLDNATHGDRAPLPPAPRARLPGDYTEDRIARERGHSTIRFVHDQIRGGKIPVAALAPGKSRIQAAIGDPAQAAAPAIRFADTA